MRFKVRAGCAGERIDGSPVKAGDELELDLRDPNDREDALRLREILDVVEVHGVTRPPELELEKPSPATELATEDELED